MPFWNDIAVEISETPNGIDYVRNKYIKLLSEVTNRNIIVY